MEVDFKRLSSVSLEDFYFAGHQRFYFNSVKSLVLVALSLGRRIFAMVSKKWQRQGWLYTQRLSRKIAFFKPGFKITIFVVHDFLAIKLFFDAFFLMQIQIMHDFCRARFLSRTIFVVHDNRFGQAQNRARSHDKIFVVILNPVLNIE